MNHESHSECSVPTHTVQAPSVHDTLKNDVVYLVYALVCVNAVVGKSIAFSIDDGALVHENETSHGRSSNPNRVCSGWVCVRASKFSYRVWEHVSCLIYFKSHPLFDSSLALNLFMQKCEKKEWNETVSGIGGWTVYWKRAHTDATSFQRIQWANGVYEWDYRNQWNLHIWFM